MSQTADDYVRIFDTTLRDGEQSPGATLTAAEKLEIARALARAGVDIIEAGFPAASQDDLDAVAQIARDVGAEVQDGRPSPQPPTIAGLARAGKEDIEKAWEAIREAKHPRIHTFLATSPIHREHKLRLTQEQELERVREMVAYARSFCEDVEFSPEDAGRTEPDFLYRVIETALDAGATTVNIPDTVGYTTPDEFGALIAGIKANVPGIDRATISVHCHNDLGLATANTLAGIRNGARQAEVAVNGIGERAGNTALEEVVMALRTREPMFGLRTGVDTTQLMRASKLVSTSTGMVVQRNKAIVGANAFAHEAGIHQDGMLKNHETYEIMQPETVGAARTELVLGKHSGKHAFASRLGELGYPLEGEALSKAFERFKTVADKKKRITDADLIALVGDELYRPREYWALEALQVACGTLGMQTATVRLRGPDDEVRTEAAMGTGPVDAVYKAIDAAVQAPATLLEYAVQSVTEGIDALGQVSVRVRGEDQPATPAQGGGTPSSPPPNESSQSRLNPQSGSLEQRVFHGHGADTDIIVASAKAYLGALNQLLSALETSESASGRDGSGAESHAVAEGSGQSRYDTAVSAKSRS